MALPNTRLAPNFRIGS